MTNECGSHEKVNFNHISAANFNCSHIFQSSGAFFRLDRQLPRLQKAISLRRFAYGCVIKSQPTKSKLPSRWQVYTSRWKAVLSEYNNIRVRLLNSEALLERTGLTLFHINETTLIKWYKDTSRVSEVRTLLQGLKLPTVQPCTAEKLPEVNTQPKEPPEPPPHPHVYIPRGGGHLWRSKGTGNYIFSCSSSCRGWPISSTPSRCLGS